MFCRACPGGPPWRTLEVLPGAPLGACRRGAGRGRAAGRGAACGCALTFAECLLSRVLVSPLSCLAHDGQIGVTRWPGLSRVVATWAHVQVSEGWSGCPSISCQHSGPKDRAKPCGPSVAAAGVGLGLPAWRRLWGLAARATLHICSRPRSRQHQGAAAGHPPGQHPGVCPAHPGELCAADRAALWGPPEAQPSTREPGKQSLGARPHGGATVAPCPRPWGGRAQGSPSMMKSQCRGVCSVTGAVGTAGLRVRQPQDRPPAAWSRVCHVCLAAVPDRHGRLHGGRPGAEGPAGHSAPRWCPGAAAAAPAGEEG